MNKAAALDAHLERAMNDLAFWGQGDCFLWPADWIERSGWPDPAGPWRGRYATALGAARIVRRAGGVEALWISRAIEIGLNPALRPVAGDVGLVEHGTTGAGPSLRGRVGAICLGAGEWATSTPAGLRFGYWPVLRAWRVPWRRP